MLKSGRVKSGLSFDYEQVIQNQKAVLKRNISEIFKSWHTYDVAQKDIINVSFIFYA